MLSSLNCRVVWLGGGKVKGGWRGEEAGLKRGGVGRRRSLLEGEIGASKRGGDRVRIIAFFVFLGPIFLIVFNSWQVVFVV